MTTIKLPADCTGEAALSHWPRLQTDCADAVAFDGSAVERIGQAMLQVLLVAGKGRPVTDASKALVEAAGLAGLDTLIDEGDRR